MNKPTADANTTTFAASVAAYAEDLLFAGGFEGVMDEVRVSSAARRSCLGTLETAGTDTPYYSARNATDG